MSQNKIKALIGFVLFSGIFIFLRIRNLDHLLMWDEAWNVLSLRAFISGTVNDPFYWYYFFHPPLYMLFAKMLFPFQSGFAMRAAGLSLFFSYITFVIVYIFSLRTGGWRLASLSGFFLSFMPASIGYDTWIKRDSLAIALGYAALLLAAKKRYVWCSVLLAFSLLTKESAVFFIASAFILLISSNEKHKLKIVFISSGIIVILSFWWHIFMSNFLDSISGIYLSASSWDRPLLYYFDKLKYDLGMPYLLFFIIGFSYILFLIIFRRQKKWVMPVGVMLSVYIPSSLLLRSKAPWTILSALPAISIMSASGAFFLMRKRRFRKVLLPALLLLMAVTAFKGMTFSYDSYHKITYPNGWPGAVSSKMLAGYLNTNMLSSDTLMISDFAYWKMPLCPIFLYYWEPHKMAVVKNPSDPEAIINHIREFNINWLVIVSSPEAGYDRSDILKKLTVLLGKEPQKVGWSYVWRI